jgi:hypothetical protein
MVYAAHHSVFPKLYEHRDLPRPLFPRLRDVALPYSEDDPLLAIFYPSVVLSSSIRKVRVITDSYQWIDPDETYHDVTNDSWKAMMGRLASVAPTLCDFRVSSTSRGENNFLVGRLDSLEKLLPRFSASMTCLKISPLIVGWSTLVALGVGGLTGLVRLSATLTEEQEADMLVDSDVKLSFPSLERLSLKVLSFGACSSFISFLDAGKLKELTVKVAMSADDEGHAADDDLDLEPLLEALSDN